MDTLAALKENMYGVANSEGAFMDPSLAVVLKKLCSY